jgi:hypothetical protein
LEQPGTVTCDLEGRVRAFDPEAERVFGYRTEEVVGKSAAPALTAGWVAVSELPAGWPRRAATAPSGPFPRWPRRRAGFAASVTLTSLRRRLHRHRPAAHPTSRAERALPTGLAPRLRRSSRGPRPVPDRDRNRRPGGLRRAWSWAAGIARPFTFLVFAAALVAAALLHTGRPAQRLLRLEERRHPGNNDHIAPFSGGSRSIELVAALRAGHAAGRPRRPRRRHPAGAGLAVLRGGACSPSGRWAPSCPGATPRRRCASRRGGGGRAHRGPVLRADDVAGAVLP